MTNTPQTIRFPIFKFQKNTHADMMFDGTVRISRISDFRDKEKHNKLTLDEGEGTALVLGHDYTKHISVDNQYIFCATSHFLSDSLIWAIREGKECCVMVTDPDEFYRRITASKEASLIFSGNRACRYLVSRAFHQKKYFELLAKNNSFLDICFCKTFEFISQREVRSMWTTRDQRITPECLYIKADIKDLLIKIEFPTFNEHRFLKKDTVVVTTHLRNNKSSSFHFESPNDVHTPIIYNDNGIDYLGYKVPTSIRGGTITGGAIGLNYFGGMQIVSVNELSDIEKIEFHFKN